MTNRLDNTSCPELDPMTDVLDIANLKEVLNDANTTLDKDLIMWRDGQVYPIGCVVLDATERTALGGRNHEEQPTK